MKYVLPILLCFLALTDLACTFTGPWDDGSGLQGVVGYFPFKGSATDESGADNDGVVFGATATEDRFGRTDNALSFDGVDDYVTIPHDELLNFGLLEVGYGVSFWMLVEGNKTARIIEKWNRKPYTPYPYQITTFPGYLQLAANDGIELPTMEIEHPGADRWHHLVFTADVEDDKLYVYLNGELAASAPLPSGSRENEFDITVGGVPTAEIDRFFKGKIDELYFFNRTLSKSDVMYLYHLED